MSWIDLLAGMTAFGLAIYLVVALLIPEKFS